MINEIRRVPSGLEICGRAHRETVLMLQSLTIGNGEGG